VNEEVSRDVTDDDDDERRWWLQALSDGGDDVDAGHVRCVRIGRQPSFAGYKLQHC